MTGLHKNKGQMLERAIKQIADGDKSALAEFYSLTAEQVLGFSLSILKNRTDAEDILSELLLEVWRCAKNYQSMGKPMAWVITIVKNLCRMKLRERIRIADDPVEEAAENFADTSGLSVEDTAVFRACMEKLSDNDREVVIMHAVAGLKHREIAVILGLPLSTVLSRYRFAIKKLSKELEGGAL